MAPGESAKDADPVTAIPETDRDAAVAAFFARDGFARVEPAILQPVDAFIELSGEDMRRRMFVTQDAAGRELCLRPEYTIPVSLAYLAGAAQGLPAGFSYHGPVFRQRGDEAGEFPQAGIESFGREDREAVDAEIFAKAHRAAVMLGLKRPKVRMGDMELIARLFTALDIPAPMSRRLMRALAAGGDPTLCEPAGRDGTGASAHDALMSAIAGLAPRAARALVEDVISIAGISQVGGRSAAEIAERFLDKAEQRGSSLSPDTGGHLARFFAISGSPEETLRALRDFAGEAAIDLALDGLSRRWDNIAAHGVDLRSITFTTRFARNIDYYTGFVFEITDADGANETPFGGGGRYDRLLTQLGAPAPVPAVGCSLWLDRFAAHRRAAALAEDAA